MKKHLFMLFSIIAFCFVLISCPNPSEEMKPSSPILDNPSVTVIETKSMKPGDTYTLDGEYTLKDGIVIDKASSKAVSETSNKFFTTGNGSIIPLPSKDKKITISASDLGITSDTNIYIGKYNVESDFMISAKEMEAKNKRGFYDEYYYVDLTDEKWSSLDKDNIVVRQTSHPGDGSYSVLINESYYSNKKDVLNLDGADGFAVYQYTSREAGFNSIPDCKIHVVNPIDLTVGKEVEVKDLFSVLRIPAVGDGKDYCLTISGIPEEIINRMAGVYYFTNFEVTRKFTGDGVIPYYYPNENKIVYHIGKIQDSFMIDLDFEEYYTKATNINAKVTLEVNNYPNIVNKENYIDLTEVANGKLDIRAPYTSSDYITLAFELNDVLTVKTDYVANGLRDAMGKFWSDGSSGIFKLPFESNYTFKNAPLVAFVTLSTNGKTINQGDLLYTISEGQITKLKAGHTYTYKSEKVSYWNGQYFSEDETISFLGTDFNKELGKEFNSNVFTCNKTIEGLGTLTIDNSLLKCSEITGSGIKLGYGVTQNESKVYRYLSKENLLVRFEVDEIVYNSIYDKALNGTIYIVRNGEETVVDDVAFSYVNEGVHTHKWVDKEVIKEVSCTEDGIKTVRCSECGETEIQEIKAQGHQVGEDAVVKPSTYFEKGFTKYTCTSCNEEIFEQSENTLNITDKSFIIISQNNPSVSVFMFNKDNSFISYSGMVDVNSQDLYVKNDGSGTYSLNYENKSIVMNMGEFTIALSCKEELNEDGSVKYLVGETEDKTINMSMYPVSLDLRNESLGKLGHAQSSSVNFNYDFNIKKIIIGPFAHEGEYSLISHAGYINDEKYSYSKCPVCGYSGEAFVPNTRKSLAGTSWESTENVTEIGKISINFNQRGPYLSAEFNMGGNFLYCNSSSIFYDDNGNTFMSLLYQMHNEGGEPSTIDIGGQIIEVTEGYFTLDIKDIGPVSFQKIEKNMQ